MARPNFTTEEIESEEWRDLPGYKHYYQISDLGRIKRIKAARGTRVGFILKSAIHREYLSVGLSKDGRSRTYYVHILVALTFLGPPPEGCEAHHKDRNRFNPRLRNLEYLTKEEHRQLAIEEDAEICPMCRRPLRVRSKPSKAPKANAVHPNSILTISDVLSIRAEYVANLTGARCLAAKYGVARSTIRGILKRETWGHI